MPVTILLDCDGVLANWCAQVLDWNDLDPALPFRSWDGHNEHGITDESITNISSCVSFWRDMPIMPGAQKLWKACKREGEAFICTAPYPDPNCLYGRSIWLQEKLGISIDETVYTKHKYLLANAGTILIDDNVENIRKFSDHGGHGILVERPYNTKRPSQTVDQLIETLVFVVEAIEKRNG